MQEDSNTDNKVSNNNPDKISKLTLPPKFSQTKVKA